MENREKQIAEVLFRLIRNSLQKLNNENENNGSTFEEDISKVLENSFNYMESEGWIGEWEKL
jgi:ribosomal protein S8